MKKEFGELSEFKNRKVKLFESSDPYNTAIYHSKGYNADNKTSSTKYQVLKFEYNYGKHQFYLKYPDTDYFVECLGCGMGSSHGSMGESSGKNIWKSDEYESENITVYEHDINMMIKFGKYGTKFNFLKLIARNNFKEEYLDRHSFLESNFNLDLIKEVLSEKYLKISEEIKKIEYAFQLENKNIFIIIDYPAYNFEYDNHRLFYFENDEFEEMKITNFERYRDGGTTYITAIDKNKKEHIFYSPTPFNKELIHTWDDIKLIDIKGTDILEKLQKIIEIELEPTYS